MKTIVLSILLSLVILGDSGMFVYDIIHADEHNVGLIDNPIEEESKESKETVEKNYLHDSRHDNISIYFIDSWKSLSLIPSQNLKNQLFKEIPESPPEV